MRLTAFLLGWKWGRENHAAEMTTLREANPYAYIVGTRSRRAAWLDGAIGAMVASAAEGVA